MVTSQHLDIDLHKLIVDLGEEIGYTKTNRIDVTRYKILDHICWLTEAPQKWTHFVNDQSIITGYAGYDSKTRFLPPVHFAAWYFRECVISELKDGLLHGHGPDGKILVVMDENENEWRIKRLLLTLQQKESYPFTDFTLDCTRVLHQSFDLLQKQDSRWIGDWKDLNVLVNPNGPLLNGGSDGDNGQTGRKLVMDFYGPEIPIGGGALYGKDLSHIDRIGSFAAREYAMELVARGARDAFVVVCYAPGMDTPLDITLRTNIKPAVDPDDFFNFAEMRKRINCSNLDYDVKQLGSFYNQNLSFNSKYKIE